jgi:hypothetical protein
LDGAQHARDIASVKKKTPEGHGFARKEPGKPGKAPVRPLGHGNRPQKNSFLKRTICWLLLALTSMKRAFFSAAAALLLAGSAFAELPDTAPMDTRQLLEALKQLKEQNEAGVKSRRSSAYQQVAAAASSAERAVAFWKDAVKAVQFEGAEKQGSKIQDWREGDGDALNDRHCASAVRLHLNWLALNLQHAAGADTRALLPKVLEHVNSVQSALEAGEDLGEDIQKARERGASSPGAKRNVQEEQAAKRVFDQVMRMSVASSPVSRWLQLGEALGDRKRGDGGWEPVAGNLDGIYNTVILPEYRSAKDPRLLEYWDMMLKREAEKAAKRKLDVEQRDWTNVRRPSILWSRAQDVLLLGQRNRAISEMFNLVKTYPQHPDAKDWISQIETLIAPPAVAPAAGIPGTPINSAVPSVPPPAALPPIPAAPGPRPAAPGVPLAR